MNRDPYSKFVVYLNRDPDDPAIRLLEESIENNPDERKEWIGFVVGQYVLGDLDDKWRQQIDQKISIDADYAEEYALQADVATVIRAERQKALRKEMQDLLPRKTVKSDRERMIRSIYYVSVAAIVLLLIAYIGGFFSQNIAPDALFAENFEPYEMVLNTRTGTEEPLLKAITYYNNGEYNSALQEFESYEGTQFGDLVPLYAGISALGSGQPEMALSIFEGIPESSSTMEQVNWYSGLAYMKLGMIAEARAKFNNVVSMHGRLESRAEKLISRLD